MTDRERVARAIAERIHENIHDGYEDVPLDEVFRRPRYQHLAERYALAADAALAAMPTWRRIPDEVVEGEAPWDGKDWLVWGLWAGEINGIGDAPERMIARYSGHRTDYPGFNFEVQGGDAYAAWCKPTHYAPLPASPTRYDGGEE